MQNISIHYDICEFCEHMVSNINNCNWLTWVVSLAHIKLCKLIRIEVVHDLSVAHEWRQKYHYVKINCMMTNTTFLICNLRFYFFIKIRFINNIYFDARKRKDILMIEKSKWKWVNILTWIIPLMMCDIKQWATIYTQILYLSRVK